MKNSHTIAHLIRECVTCAVDNPPMWSYNDKNENDRRLTFVYNTSTYRSHYDELVINTLEDILTWLMPKKLKFKSYRGRGTMVRVQIRLTYKRVDAIVNNRAIWKRLEHEKFIRKLIR